jgi:hypothetical protein
LLGNFGIATRGRYKFSVTVEVRVKLILLLNKFSRLFGLVVTELRFGLCPFSFSFSWFLVVLAMIYKRASSSESLSALNVHINGVNISN